MNPDVGKLIIVTAPSGAGKTTIVHHLLDHFDQLDFSVSATTRPKRVHELEGKDYYFISLEQFQQFIAQDAFVEYQMVYQDQYYGTLRSELTRIWDRGHHIVFDIDVRGAINMKKMFEEQALAIFIRPPSFEVLKQRLLNRKTETPESIQKRIQKAENELKFEYLFDYVIVNDDLETACKEAEMVIQRFIDRPLKQQF